MLQRLHQSWCGVLSQRRRQSYNTFIKIYIHVKTDVLYKNYVQTDDRVDYKLSAVHRLRCVRYFSFYSPVIPYVFELFSHRPKLLHNSIPYYINK